jgi:phage tail sheath protein FI
MTIYQDGSLNASALYAPGVYTQIIAPTTLTIAGVQANILGYVGVGSWGPVNSPVVIGSPAEIKQNVGAVTVRKRDLATALTIALSLGASQLRSVRVTDGTDLAARALLVDTASTPVTGATLTGLYTGSVGNGFTGSITTGTKASTFKLTLNRPGFTSEVYDNIAGSGATFWANLVTAVNSGISDQRGPSNLVIATIGTSSAAPAVGTTVTFSGGTDGATGVTDAMLVGVDGATNARTGMYALRGSGAMTGILVDHTDTTAWSGIGAFGLSEGIFFGGAGPIGASYATVGAALSTSGTDSYGFKALIGDWVYWQDQVNGVQRLLSPATFWGAMRASVNPNQSTLNKQVNGIIGTQMSVAQTQYSNADLAAIAQLRLDFIANPSAGGNYFSFQTDRNSSSDTNRNSEAYTTMINYLALSLQNAMGFAIGRTQDPGIRGTVKDMTTTFLTTQWKTNGFIGDVNNPETVPFVVTLDASNNPDDLVAQGVMQMYVKVKFLSIIREFIVSLEGGQSVSVTVK